MFLPTGDTPNPRNFTPYVNWALIAANVLVYILITFPLSGEKVDPADPALKTYLETLAPSLPPGTSLYEIASRASAYDLFVFSHGFKPGAPELSDLFFSMFLHGGLLHLFGNMLFLWIYGDNVEHYLGRWGYLGVYLLTGVAATGFFSAFSMASLIPLVGASGAISGVLGLYFLLFPRNKVKVFVAIYPFFFNIILLPARWVLGFYLLVDNLFPFVLGSGTGVAHGAHIGGFLMGLAVAGAGEGLGWRLPWVEKRTQRRARKSTAETGPPPSPLTSLRQAMARDNGQEALFASSFLSSEDLKQLAPEECRRLASWLEETGCAGTAVRILRMAISQHPPAPQLGELYLQLGLVRLRQGQPTAAYQHLLAALDCSPDAQTEARARQAIDRIHGQG